MKGNIASDLYKAMTVAYNHLNLPKLMTFTGEVPNNTIDILYDAADPCWRQVFPDCTQSSD
ncbi:MAG: hypothetical protein R2830_25330 [Saprospiraceae bacterium]